MRFYSRKELAEILSVNINDSKHFADNVKAKLRKWGYGFEYVRAKGAVITSIPTTAEERLAEIMIRQYDLDVQISPYAFSCFVTAFSDIEGFDSMPWGERAKAYYFYSGILVDERTLRNWCSRLMRQGAVSKADEVTYWKTEFIHGIKVRSQVQREETLAYYARRSEIVQEEMEQNARIQKDAQRAYDCFWSLLTPEAKEAYLNYTEANIELMSISEADTFTKGFRLGVQLLLAGICEDDTQLPPLEEE